MFITTFSIELYAANPIDAISDISEVGVWFDKMFITLEVDYNVQSFLLSLLKRCMPAVIFTHLQLQIGYFLIG